MSGLVSGRFTAKVSQKWQNELQSFAAKVWSCQWMLHCKSFTKWIAKFRSKGSVLSVDASPQKFYKMNCKVSQERSDLVSGCFTAKFHKMNCKVSQQRFGLACGCFTTKVSQNELQSFAAKVLSCQWMLHRKSFTKWIAQFHSKGPVLSVDASPAQQRSSNVSVDRGVYLVLEILGQKPFSAVVTAQAAFHKLSLGVRYIGVPLHICQFAWQARRTRQTRENIFCTVDFVRAN